MPIRSVEVICMPCAKCQDVETKIKNAIKNIEFINHAKIIYEFKFTPQLRDLANYSLNPSQTPAILINGRVEFAGRLDWNLIGRRLDAVQRSD